MKSGPERDTHVMASDHDPSSARRRHVMIGPNKTSLLNATKNYSNTTVKTTVTYKFSVQIVLLQSFSNFNRPMHGIPKSRTFDQATGFQYLLQE